MSKKDKIELEIFNKFAKFAELPINFDTIEHRNPPEPDIFCRHISGNPLRYELVELIDEDFASGMSWVYAEKIIRSAYERLDHNLRSDFDKLFENADISFEFNDSTTMNMVAQSATSILKELLKLGDSFTGAVDLTSSSFSGLMRSLRIARGNFKGPFFNIQLYLRIGDPTLPALKKKFQKSYQSDTPIELVAYVASNIMFPDSVWRPTVEDFFNSISSYGQFKKIWIVDIVKEVVEFVFEDA